MVYVLDIITSIMKRLEKIHTDSVSRQQDAWWVLQALTKKSEAELLALSTVALSPQQTAQLEQWLDAHINEHKPLQYILGNVPFNSLTIKVEPPILIPRPETEEWSYNLGQELAHLKNKRITIADVCSGTGCIALGLAKVSSSFNVYATDISEHAIALGKQNAQLNSVKNATFIHSDLLDNIDMTFDLIVSNPPYIPDGAWKDLNPSVTQWEDKQALISGKDGLDCIRKLIKQAHSKLVLNKEFKEQHIPQLVIEIDYTQGQHVQQLLSHQGFSSSRIVKDLEGKDRVVYAEL